MARFVPVEEVAVFLPEDAAKAPAERPTMYIKPKMDFGTKRRVLADLMALAEGNPYKNLGLYNLALARHNIVRWSGPGFDGVPCTPENIDRLDPEEDRLLVLALDELARRNPLKAPDPKDASDASAGPSAPSGVASPSERTT